MPTSYIALIPFLFDRRRKHNAVGPTLAPVAFRAKQNIK
jgi:hypothetical protein